MNYRQLFQRTNVVLARFVGCAWFGVLALAAAHGPKLLRNSFVAAGNKLDMFFSGVWWWRVRRQLAEKRLDQALERFGDRSIAARWATERYREMQFAVTYWRRTPPLIRRVVLTACQAGLPTDDLRLIAFNADLRVRGNEVFLRRSTLMRALSAAFATVVCVQWALMCCLVVLVPGPALLKVLVILGIFIVYATLYRGWSLFAYRAFAAIERSGNQLDQICARLSSDQGQRPISMTGAEARMIRSDDEMVTDRVARETT